MDETGSVINFSCALDAISEIEKTKSEFMGNVPKSNQISGCIGALNDAGFDIKWFNDHDKSIDDIISLVEAMQITAYSYIDNTKNRDKKIEESIPDERTIEDSADTSYNANITSGDDSNNMKSDTETIESATTNTKDLNVEGEEEETLKDISKKDTQQVELDLTNGKGKDKQKLDNINKDKPKEIDISEIDKDGVNILLKKLIEKTEKQGISIEQLLFDPECSEIIKKILTDLNYTHQDGDVQEMLRQVMIDNLNITNENELKIYIEEFIRNNNIRKNLENVTRRRIEEKIGA